MKKLLLGLVAGLVLAGNCGAIHLGGYWTKKGRARNEGLKAAAALQRGWGSLDEQREWARKLHQSITTLQTLGSDTGLKAVKAAAQGLLNDRSPGRAFYLNAQGEFWKAGDAFKQAAGFNRADSGQEKAFKTAASEAYEQQGKQHDERKEYGQAAEFYQKARALATGERHTQVLVKELGARSNHAQALAAAGQHGEAAAVYEAAEELATKNARYDDARRLSAAKREALIAHATKLSEDGDHQGASNAYQRAQKYADAAREAIALAEQRKREENFLGAIDAYRRAASLSEEPMVKQAAAEGVLNAQQAGVGAARAKENFALAARLNEDLAKHAQDNSDEPAAKTYFAEKASDHMNAARVIAASGRAEDDRTEAGQYWEAQEAYKEAGLPERAREARTAYAARMQRVIDEEAKTPALFGVQSQHSVDVVPGLGGFRVQPDHVKPLSNREAVADAYAALGNHAKAGEVHEETAKLLESANWVEEKRTQQALRDAQRAYTFAGDIEGAQRMSAKLRGGAGASETTDAGVKKVAQRAVRDINEKLGGVEHEAAADKHVEAAEYADEAGLHEVARRQFREAQRRLFEALSKTPEAAEKNRLRGKIDGLGTRIQALPQEAKVEHQAAPEESEDAPNPGEFLNNIAARHEEKEQKIQELQLQATAHRAEASQHSLDAAEQEAAAAAYEEQANRSARDRAEATAAAQSALASNEFGESIGQTQAAQAHQAAEAAARRSAENAKQLAEEARAAASGAVARATDLEAQVEELRTTPVK